MKRNEILGEISDKALRDYNRDAHTEIQGAKFGRDKGTPEGEKTIAKREKGMAAAHKRLKARDDEKRANYKRPEPAKGPSGPQDWYGQNRYMGDSVEQGVAEGGKDVKDIWAADTQMLNILLNPDRKQLTDYTPEEISQLQKLAKILGRARKIIGGKFTGMSIGQVLDKLEDNSRLKQRDGGKMPDFTGRATTTADMGKQIALHTNGNFYTSQGKTWTSGRTGQRIRDANDYIKYNDKKSLDDAWAWVQSKGKKVNYRDNFNHLQTAVQIGSFIVEPNTVTRDVSGSNLDTEHGLSVRSVKSLSQWSRKREEQGVAEGSEDKIKQLKADHATAVHWSKNEKSPQKREAARQKAEKIKAHLEKQYKQGVAEGLEEGRSDYVGDAIEGLRMAKPGLEKEDFLDELYSYIDAEMGMEAAERAFADKDAYDDWYDSYADAMDENANMLKVAKDDDKQTILQNPGTGVQTQIDKTNPNAPSLTKDETTGKLKLAAPAQGGAAEVKPNLVGKDVEVATESADLTAMLRIAGLR
jgi:hypothetical protein